jgi:hypothetical protein
MRRTRGTHSLLVAAVIVMGPILASGTPALSAIRIGTDQSETLTGTNGNDHLTGKGGNDTLRGLAGNDVYDFTDGWGGDTLEEKAKYKIGGKKVPGGTDTLSFRGVSSGSVAVRLLRQWGPSYNGAFGSNGELVILGTSVVENAVGTRSSSPDILTGGGEKNVLQPGGGVDDSLQDNGGYNDGPGGEPELPVSNDTFKGLNQNTGTISVFDWGGSGDVLDLRPFGAGDVYLDAIDVDGDPAGTKESLQIVTGGTSQVVVYGHFGDIAGLTSATGQHGRIERLIFADGTFSGASGVSTSKQSLTRKQAKLAEAAPRLVAEARRLAAEAPPAGDLPSRR